MFDKRLNKYGLSLNRVGIAFLVVGIPLVVSCTNIKEMPPVEIAVAGVNLAMKAR